MCWDVNRLRPNYLSTHCLYFIVLSIVLQYLHTCKTFFIKGSISERPEPNILKIIINYYCKNYV